MSLTAYMREFETSMSDHWKAAAPNAYALAISRATRDAAGETIAKYITSEHPSVAGLSVVYESATRSMTVRGIAPDHSTRDKVLASCRKIIGVAHFTDLLTIAETATLEAQYQLSKRAAANKH